MLRVISSHCGPERGRIFFPMGRISDRFATLSSRGEKALVAFVTAGDPPLDELPAILETLQEAGADLIEIGIPFSDPIADGPTIQASSQRALDGGVNPGSIFSVLRSCKLEVPAIVMGYYNTALRRGLDAFASDLHSAGLSGAILSDLTPEESDEWVEASHRHDLSPVFLAAPTSTDERLDVVCKRSEGFVYAVSRTGVTGALETVPPEVKTLVNRIKSRTQLPVCVGFGVSKPEHVSAICEVADGAVVGSWLVNLIHEEWQDGAGRNRVRAKVAELKAATRA